MPIEQTACNSASRSSSLAITQGALSSTYLLARSAKSIIKRIALLYSRASKCAAICSDCVINSAKSTSSSSLSANFPSKRFAIKLALREAKFTNLFTISLFTRWTKSSRLKSKSSIRSFNFAA